MKILQTLEQYHIPTTGFVIAGSIEPGQRKWLKTFKQAGYGLGKHTIPILIVLKILSNCIRNTVTNLSTYRKRFKTPITVTDTQNWTLKILYLNKL
ncbi:hypothetical protein [Candidatus Coxiella mudrowiae]|uniref:hypothetical protein n=1 Tax=Candidatus Coxiella mudrowiae TaxID=2054173 RepID=UPI000C28204A|nr:hypothetical protein [Candidatus Coxiella mudrowiae]